MNLDMMDKIRDFSLEKIEIDCFSINDMRGQDICLNYVPELKNARRWNGKSYNQHIKNNPLLLEDARDLVWDFTLNLEEPTEHQLFKAVARIVGGLPTNFPPMLVRQILKEFIKPGEILLDYSMGFGGRLLGAMTDGYQYIGFDTNKQTVIENFKLAEAIYFALSEYSTIYEPVLINESSVNIGENMTEKSVDLAFSCPPYYSMEIYSSDERDSVNSTLTYSQWLKDYVGKTCKAIYKVLKSGKYFLTYIGNVSPHGMDLNLCDDWIKMAEQNGFTLIEARRPGTHPAYENTRLLIFQKGE